jgi:hypothetical protein
MSTDAIKPIALIDAGEDPVTPLSLEDARRQVNGYVEHYNNFRLNSAIGYIAPKSPPTGLLGVGLGGDSNPRMIAFRARLEF